MFKKIFGLAAFALCGLLVSPQAHAQELKVGYTDHEVLLANMPQMAQVRQQLQQAFQTSQGRLQTQAQDLQERAERYQRQQSLLSDSARANREQELAALQQQVQQAAQQAEQQLQQREVELMRPLYESLQDAIDGVAQERGLDLVLPTQVGGQPFILYVNRDRIVDITREVAVRLGIPIPDESAQNN